VEIRSCARGRCGAMKYGNAGFNGASNVTCLKITCEPYAYESCFLKGLIFTETSSGSSMFPHICYGFG